MGLRNSSPNQVITRDLWYWPAVAGEPFAPALTGGTATPPAYAPGAMGRTGYFFNVAAQQVATFPQVSRVADDRPTAHLRSSYQVSLAGACLRWRINGARVYLQLYAGQLVLGTSGSSVGVTLPSAVLNAWRALVVDLNPDDSVTVAIDGIPAATLPCPGQRDNAIPLVVDLLATGGTGGNALMGPLQIDYS